MTQNETVRQLLGDPDFDPDFLREKYLLERNKRIRSDGNSQYVEPEAEFSKFADDPYADPDFARPALNDAVDVVIVGAGFGGLITGARLRERGFSRIRLIDDGGDVGGTWYWNRYPGAQCDVESLIYLPLLEELGYKPKHRYSYAPEIFEYCRAIARRYDLYADACFRTRVTAMTWLEDDRQWRIRTDRDDDIRAQYVVTATGLLSRPKLPGIPGIASFRGRTFHTSRWDYAYTGGDPTGNLEGLRDKRVGLVGTGATAVQCVPALGRSARQLYLFQRTPCSVDVRNQSPLDPGWFATQEPGWQQRRMDNFNILVSGGDQEVDLVGDRWTDIFRRLTGISARRASEVLGRRLTAQEKDELLELLDFEKMEEIRGRITTTVHDRDVAEALKPWYRLFCKRPCFHDDYLPTFNLPSVQLVDTEGHGIERVVPNGVVVRGREYPLDCLIFATGFEVGTEYTHASGFDIAGRDGRLLSEKGKPGIRTLHGMQTNGFPNCFFLGFTETARTVNVPHALSEQARHISYIMGSARDRGASVAEATPEGERGWGAEMRRTAGRFDKLYAECTPSYYNSEGDINNPHGFYATTYGGGPVAFFDLLHRWRAAGNLDGVALS